MTTIAVDARTMSCRPSGIGIYLADYLSRLQKRPDLSLLLFSDVAESSQIKDLQSSGVPVYCYGKRVFRSADVYRYFSFVRKNLVAEQPALFWEPNNLIPVTLSGYVGKTVVTLHDVFPLTNGSCYSPVYKTYYRFSLAKTRRTADAFLFDSSEVRETVCSLFPEIDEKKYLISHIIVNTPPEFPLSNEGYFLSLGNLEERKGTDILLWAYRLYREAGGALPLKIAGSVKDENLRPSLESLLTDYPEAQYLGYVTEEEKYRLLAGCSAFVFPSRAEGFGLPPLEALAYRKPVIAADLPIYKEITKVPLQTFSLAGDGGEQARALSERLLTADFTPYPEETCEAVLANYRGEVLAERLAGFFTDLVKTDEDRV